ncbi:MAG: GNAT family N-acetyltransferase [Rhodospirillaceae bacterium]
MALIRRARIADAPGIGKVYVESWRATYPGLVPDGYLLGMSEQATTERWQAQLAALGDATGVYVALERQQGLVGFASCGTQRTAIAGYGGELYTLYLLDTAQGHGLGRRLMAAAAADLVARGIEGMVVWVLRDNPSRWFYERLGGQRLGEQTICLGRILLPEIAYGWRDLAELTRLPINPPLG